MKLLYGIDAVEGLKTLADESVHTCVTSPPYWGLRDYGTADWEGGKAECDHKIPATEQDRKNPNAGSHISRFNKTHCYKCGAKRIDSQIGLEATPEEYVEKMVAVFREVRRVLRSDGTLWLNLGDSYAGSGGTGSQFGQVKSGLSKVRPVRPAGGLKAKDLVGIPWMVAFALRADGWYLRQDIIWHKPNPMPEPVTDRCTKSHEYIFLFAKSPKYFFDNEVISEPVALESKRRAMRGNSIDNKYAKGEERPEGVHANTMSQPRPYRGYANMDEAIENGETTLNENGLRNKRSVWSVTTRGFPGAHFATFPQDLIIPMIQAGCPKGGVVLDPFSGSGTTGEVAFGLGRDYIGIDLSKEYEELARSRFGLFVT